MSVDAILKEIEALTDAEQEELLAVLAERFAPDEARELPLEVKTELERRIAKADADPSAGIPWEVVYEESLKRARK